MTFSPMKHRASVSTLRSLSGRMGVVFLSILFSGGIAAAQESSDPDRESRNDRSAQQDPESSRGQGRGRQGRGGEGGRGGDGGEFRGRRDGDGPRGGREGRGGRGRDRGEGFSGGGPDRGRGGGPEGRRGGDPATRGLGIMGTPEGFFSPDYLTRDVPMVIAELDLADDQRAIVVELFNIYDVSFREVVDDLRSQTDQIRASHEPDPQIEERIQGIRDQMRSMRQQMREVRDSLRGDRGSENANRGNQRNVDRPDARDIPRSEEARQNDRQAQAEARRDELRDGYDMLREDMREMREAQIKSDQMQAMLDKRMNLLREFARKKKELKDSVELGIRSLLLEHQVEEWESIERTLRRKRLMPRGRLSGESTDLIDILKDFQITETHEADQLHQLVDAYGISLDLLLRSRDQFDHTDALDLMDQLRKWEFEAALRTMRNRLSIQESIRDLNDQYIEVISSSLSGLDRNDFRRQSLMRGYSRIFRPTSTERILVNAMEIEDLDPDVLGSVADLMQAHADEIAVANEDLLILLRQEDSNRALGRATRRIESMQGIESESASFDPMREAFDVREKIDDRYLDTLRSLLVPEQFEGIAGRRGERGERDQDGRGRGRGGNRETMRERMTQFDTNGDGELDEHERRAIREQFQRGGRGGGRPQGPPPGEV